MMLFPLWIVKILVVGALTLAATGLIVLLLLLWRDSRERRIW